MESINFKDALELPGQSDVQISPDGRRIIYTQSEVNWDKNRYDRNLWLLEADSEPKQLTFGPPSAHGARWSPDGKQIAFLTRRGDDKGAQIYLYDLQSEAKRLTKHDAGIFSPAWSPDGQKIAFLSREPLTEAEKEREESYGDLRIENEDYRFTHLWVADVADGKIEQLTAGKEWTVNVFRWSPDSQSIAFTTQPAPDLEHLAEVQTRIIQLQTLAVRPIGSLNRRLLDWSLDGDTLFVTFSPDPAFLMNHQLMAITVADGDERVVPVNTDDDIWGHQVCEKGIFAIVPQGTSTELWLIDPQDGSHERINTVDPNGFFGMDATITADGNYVGCLASNAESLAEVIRIATDGGKKEQWSTFTEQVAEWPLTPPEDFRWQSLDGTEVEGVLYRPVNFDPAQTYPLFVIIHGGPSWFSARELLPGVFKSRYPGMQWLERGAFILMPNYRGSIGYGQKFKALNYRNLGMGDYEDVISGVDALIASENIDPDRIGAMGWSQGGYISAFITTYSDRFKAVSVGAGISNWLTYYVNTDIHEFTRQYLGATPWDDPEIYAYTSPMTHIKKAQTPTLIQHGEFDRRVPTPNAYELYQGLRDVEVPTRLVIYKEMGHGITLPRLQKHTLQDNFDWFEKYLWVTEEDEPERNGTVYIALPEDAEQVRRWAVRDQVDFRILTWEGLVAEAEPTKAELPEAEVAAALLSTLAAELETNRWENIVFQSQEADKKVRTLVDCITQAANVLGGGLHSAAN